MEKVNKFQGEELENLNVETDLGSKVKAYYEDIKLLRD
jgi:hypothetical protein